MSRTLTNDFRDTIVNRFQVEDLIVFATLTHPSLEDAIRVCSEPPGIDYSYNGFTYTSIAFALSFLTDEDNPPSGHFSVIDIEGSMGLLFRSVSSPIKAKLEWIHKSEFDDSATSPRSPISTPIVQLTAQELLLENIQGGENMFITGDIAGFGILTTEPWPSIRTVPSKTPALFY